MQNQTHFWSRWAPPNGRLNPEQDQAERQAEPVDEDTDTHRNSESRQHLPKSARIQSRVKDPDFNIDSVLPGDFSGGRRPTAATTETVTKAGGKIMCIERQTNCSHENFRFHFTVHRISLSQWGHLPRSLRRRISV